MRQANASVLERNKFLRILLCIFLLLSGSIKLLQADITSGPTLTVTSDGDRINSQGTVSLKADWTGDTPPFTATFKANGNILVSSPGDSSASTEVLGSNLREGNNSFSVTVIETSVPNAVSKDGNGDKTVNVDKTAPTVTVTLSGTSFSNNVGSNIVSITVTSNEPVEIPDVVTEPFTGNLSSDPSNQSGGTSFRYTLTLTGSNTGTYNVRATCKDLTMPPSGANTGTNQAAFSVDATTPGAGAITSSTPPSPTNSPNVSLTGTAASDWDATRGVEILSGGTVVSSGNITGGNWTASIANIAAGSNSYTVRGYNTNGTSSSESAPFVVIVDNTPPTVPIVTPPTQTITNASRITLNGTVDISAEVSPPVTVKVSRNGAFTGVTETVSSNGAYSVTIDLVDGSNAFTIISVDAAGNSSDPSDSVTVIKDGSGEVDADIDRLKIYEPIEMPLPVPAGYILGSGIYKMEIVFGKDMNINIMPAIAITFGGGSVVNSTGSWADSKTYQATMIIPENAGAGYSGASTINISGAKDVAGNNMKEYIADAFTADAIAPVSSFNEMTDIHISGTTPTAQLSGTVSDTGGAGIDYVNIVYQNIASAASGTIAIPILPSSTSWSHNWDTSALPGGNYRLWVSATDKAQPAPNIENYAGKTPRNLLIDRDVPTVARISLGNMNVDINAMGDPPTIASTTVTRLTALFADTGGSSLDFVRTTFTLDAPGGNIGGNYTNNGNDTVFFDFDNLVANGTYTVSVTPVDRSGNIGIIATRTFIIDRTAPETAITSPTNESIANKTNEALAVNQVWATLEDRRASYANSTIRVRYNGEVVGQQLASSGTGSASQRLTWSLYLDNLLETQEHDGRYNITVVPHSNYGVIGNPIETYFTYDSQAPVITKTFPQIDLKNNEPVWIGLNDSTMSLTVSDAPKDIVEYGSDMPGQTGMSFEVPGDSSWYNGQGSEVDLNISSFSYTFDDQVVILNPNSYNVEITRPNPPANVSAGVGSITINVILKDRSGNEGEVPNTFSASYTYLFDYLPPQISTITQPNANNNKYCKDVVTFSGIAIDQGDSDVVKVAKIQYSEDSLTWIDLSSTGLPAKEANFSSTLSIAGKPEGTYAIKIRAVDLAGNVSEEKSATYVIDRTGPVAPSLSIPMPGYITNSRGQLLKWVAVADVVRYLLQVSDDSSFNNILNPETSVGQLLTMPEGAFAAPKDGSYYWRVAAIEGCVDGFNIGNFSKSRVFTVDTVKPKIVSVSPSPSESNKVSTGMVTFTIRFNEAVDTTISPSVRLVTNGGQMIVIEKTSYSEDTWIGTTVIPKNNSELYDGIAIISIEGAKDIAGNSMVSNSSNNIVINTTPAFTTKIFSNPANEYEIMIIVKSTESLQGVPVCTVQQSSSKTPVTMNFLKDRYYAGSYKIDISSPGRAYIDISGTDLYGMVGYGSVQFTVADLSASSRLNITSASGNATLKAAEGSAYSNVAIFMVDRNNLDSPFASDRSASVRASAMPSLQVIEQKSATELVGLVPLEDIGPYGLRLKKRMLYTAKLGSASIDVPSNKVHIYRLGSNGKWIFQGGELIGNEISAQLTGLGRIALMADMTAPALSDCNIQNLERLEDQFPEIIGEVADTGSGLKLKTFKLYVNGMKIPDVSLSDDGKFSYKIRHALPKGKNDISFEVIDNAGNNLRKDIVVDSPGRFAASEFMPYPNPSTGSHMFFNYNFNQAPDRVSLRIYDVAGHKVAEFDEFDFSNNYAGKLRWDLRNDSGRRVANGVYFYKLEIIKATQKFKKTGKLAVMR